MQQSTDGIISLKISLRLLLEVWAKMDIVVMLQSMRCQSVVKSWMMTGDAWVL